MPELPEVETVARDIRSALVDSAVTSVALATDRARYSGLEQLVGRRLQEVTRRGKYILVSAGEVECVIHLGMSGRLFVASAMPDVPHVRLGLELSNKKWLVFVDRRRFGLFRVVKSRDYQAFPTL